MDLFQDLVMESSFFEHFYDLTGPKYAEKYEDSEVHIKSVTNVGNDIVVIADAALYVDNLRVYTATDLRLKLQEVENKGNKWSKQTRARVLEWILYRRCKKLRISRMRGGHAVPPSTTLRSTSRSLGSLHGGDRSACPDHFREWYSSRPRAHRDHSPSILMF